MQIYFFICNTRLIKDGYVTAVGSLINSKVYLSTLPLISFRASGAQLQLKGSTQISLDVTADGRLSNCKVYLSTLPLVNFRSFGAHVHMSTFFNVCYAQNKCKTSLT